MVSLIDHENALSQRVMLKLYTTFLSLEIWDRFVEKSLRTSKTDFLAYLVVDSMAFRPRGTQTEDANYFELAVTNFFLSSLYNNGKCKTLKLTEAHRLIDRHGLHDSH